MGSVNFFTRSDLLFQRSRVVFLRSQGVGPTKKILKNLNWTKTKEGRLGYEQFFQS